MKSENRPFRPARYTPFSFERGRRVCHPLVLFLLFTVVLSCKPKLPAGVLSDAELESVLYDYHLAQSIPEVNPSGSVDARRYELQQAVLRKHGITQEEFDSTMNYYCRDLERMNVVYQHLATRMEREAEAIGTTAISDVYAGFTAEGDTANMWNGKKVVVLRNRHVDNLQSWQQTCDSTWLPGDDILFRFMPRALARNASSDIYATVVVVYSNDSVRGKTISLAPYSQGNCDIRIDDKEGWTPASVSGHIYAPVQTDPQMSQIYFINNISLIRFHKSQEWRDKLNRKNNAAQDSTAVDSLAADTLVPSPTAGETLDGRRLSPDEFRDLQPVDRKIEIVKEKPFQMRKRGGVKGKRKRR